MLCHVIYQVMSYVFYHVVYQVMTYAICHFISGHVCVSLYIIPYVMSCHTSYHRSCNVISCHIISYVMSFNIACHMSCHVSWRVGWVGRARHHWGGDGHLRQDDGKVVGYQKNYFKCFNDTISFSIHEGILITGNNIA